SKRLERNDGARFLDARDGLHLFIYKMADVGLVLDVELYQQIEISCRRVDFRGKLGIRKLVRDGVGLAQLTLDLNKERDHSPLRPPDSRLHAIQQNRAALTRRAAAPFRLLLHARQALRFAGQSQW